MRLKDSFVNERGIQCRTFEILSSNSIQEEVYCQNLDGQWLPEPVTVGRPAPEGNSLRPSAVRDESSHQPVSRQQHQVELADTSDLTVLSVIDMVLTDFADSYGPFFTIIPNYNLPDVSDFQEIDSIPLSVKDEFESNYYVILSPHDNLANCAHRAFALVEIAHGEWYGPSLFDHRENDENRLSNRDSNVLNTTDSGRRNFNSGCRGSSAIHVMNVFAAYPSEFVNFDQYKEARDSNQLDWSNINSADYRMEFRYALPMGLGGNVPNYGDALTYGNVITKSPIYTFPSNGDEWIDFFDETGLWHKARSVFIENIYGNRNDREQIIDFVNGVEYQARQAEILAIKQEYQREIESYSACDLERLDKEIYTCLFTGYGCYNDNRGRLGHLAELSVADTCSNKLSYGDPDYNTYYYFAPLGICYEDKMFIYRQVCD